MSALGKLRLAVLPLAAFFIPLAKARGEDLPGARSPLEQTILSDLVIFGTVTGLEPQAVLAERDQATVKTAHLVAAIRVHEMLLGPKGLTHVRVGFVPENREYADSKAVLFT